MGFSHKLKLGGDKLKKIILTLISLILITGCSAEYNIEFENNQFNEKIKIGPYYKEKEEIVEITGLSPFYINENNIYYDDKFKNNYYNLEHNFSFSEYRLSTAINGCFDLANISYDNDYYYIMTTGPFKCLSYNTFTADKVTINFKTNYEVVSINADYNKDGTYSWVFDKNNSETKEINIKLKKNNNSIKKEKKDQTPLEKIINNNTFQYFVIVIPISLIIFIIYKILKKYSDKKNEI